MHAAVKSGSFRKAAAAVGLAVCLMAGTAGAQTPNTAWYSASGTNFNISTADQLAGLAAIVNGTATGIARNNFSGKTVTLTADVDLSGYSNWVPIGSGSTAPFEGKFDGGARVIKNLKIERDADYQGLFGYMVNGTISNVKLEDVDIDGKNYVGGLVGMGNSATRITNCYSTGQVLGRAAVVGGLVGGLVGVRTNAGGGAILLAGGYIRNSYSSCEIWGYGDGVGGVVGTNKYGDVVNCYSTGSVRGHNRIEKITGGVIGICDVCTAKDNAALNNEVIGLGNDVRRVIGKTSGSFTASNNIAFSGLKNRDGNTNWAGTVTNNGADYGMLEIAASSTLGNRFTAANGWTVETGKLPGLGAAVAIPAHLKVPDPQKPNITVQPKSADYPLKGTAAALSVTVASVTDGGTLSYQWFCSATPVLSEFVEFTGVTSNTFTPPTAYLSRIYYYCRVTNTNNNRTTNTVSNIVAITVKTPAAQVPAITAHPQNATYSQNGTAAPMYVIAGVADGGTLSYQWYRNTTPANTGGTAVGTNSDKFTPPTTASGTLYYYVRVRNTNADAFDPAPKDISSNVAAVTVNEMINAQSPVISAQPLGATYRVNGSAAPLSVTAGITEGGTLSYQWHSNTANGNSGGTAIGGATSASYTPPVTAEGTRYYYAVVTNTNNSVNGVKTASVASNVAVVITVAAGAQAPDIAWYTADPAAASFTISTADELAGLAQIVNGDYGTEDSFFGKTITLSKDVNLAGYDNWMPIGYFSGTFDGGGRIISNLTINRPGADLQGLFGWVAGNVKNLGLENVNIKGQNRVGGVAGYVVGIQQDIASVSNCYTTGAVNGRKNVGGLVGSAGSGGYAVADSYSFCAVNGVEQVGGVIGYFQRNGVHNCYSAGAVSGANYVGGVVGRRTADSGLDSCAALNPSVNAILDTVGRVVSLNAPEAGVAYAGIKNNMGSVEWENKGADKIDGADISAEDIRADGSIGGLFTAANGWTVENGKLPGLFGKAVDLPEHLRDLSVSVQEPSREIRITTITGEAAVTPSRPLTAEFTAGPNPAAKSAGAVNFYRQGGRVDGGKLTIYDAAGNVVRKVRIKDAAAGALRATPETPRRQVGFWDLKDSKGRNVPDGAYLVKGVLKSPGGKAEKVSLLVGVR